MRIAILAHNLRTGGGFVVGFNFLSSLRKTGGKHQYLIFAPAGIGYQNIVLPKGSNMIFCDQRHSFIPRLKFDLFELPGAVKDFKPDIIIGLGNLGLTIEGCKQAILVHKPHICYPAKHYSREKYFARFVNWVIKNKIRKCLKYTDLIFCQTPVMQERFAQVFGYPSEKIKIMPMGVSELLKAGSGNTAVPACFKQKGYFNLLLLSKFYAHKNFEILIDLFNKHRSRLEDVRVIITISPEQHKNAPGFLNNIEKYNLQKYICNVGSLKQNEVAGYYRHSDALFSPTLLETFGLPYIEAMNFCLPILTSDLDFARYVCGDAALYFDPWDADDIMKKILELKNNPGLREILTSKGKTQLSRLSKSWDEITVDVIHELETLAS